jgi:hypothetical protein
MEEQVMELRKKMVGQSGFFAVAAVAGLLGGCATSGLYPPPTAGQVAATESAVAVAQQDGQQGDTNATRHLRLAEQQLADAKQLATASDNRGAALTLARAQADAELSQVLSRRARNEASAAEAERVLEETRAASGVKPSSQPAPAPAGPGPALPPQP